jgi:hypothetical protein
MQYKNTFVEGIKAIGILFIGLFAVIIMLLSWVFSFFEKGEEK